MQTLLLAGIRSSVFSHKESICGHVDRRSSRTSTKKTVLGGSDAAALLVHPANEITRSEKANANKKKTLERTEIEPDSFFSDSTERKNETEKGSL